MLPFDATAPQRQAEARPVVGVPAEKVRQASNRDKLLAVLKSRRVITNVEAVDICGLGYSGRIYELRKRGHSIEVTRRQGGLWEIAYLG